MTTNKLAVFWFRAAAVYLMAGVLLGCAMGATHQFALRSVHAHINLLGWATMLGMGLLTRVFGDHFHPRLAWVQFWIYQIGLAAMLVALAAVTLGLGSLEPLLGAASVVVAAAVALMVFNLWRMPATA